MLFKPAFLSATKFCSNIGLSSPIVALKNPAPRFVIKESKENLSNQWLIEYLQIDSLFYNFSPEWRQHFEKHTILPFLYHLSNTITTDDYKRAKIVIYLSRIYRVTPWCLWPKSFLGQHCDQFNGNSVGARSKTLQDPRKTKL